MFYYKNLVVIATCMIICDWILLFWEIWKINVISYNSAVIVVSSRNMKLVLEIKYVFNFK